MTVYQSVKRAYEESRAHSRSKGYIVQMKRPRIAWDWNQVDEHGRPMRIVKGWAPVPNTYVTRHSDGSYGVTLYNTEILHVTRSGRVTLSTGGWDTVTTKDRMNAFLRDAGYTVASERRVWKVFRVGSWGTPFAEFNGYYCQFLDRKPARVAGVAS